MSYAFESGPHPQVHEREEVVERSKTEYGLLVSELRQKHGLSVAELLFIITGELRLISQAAIASERRARS